MEDVAIPTAPDPSHLLYWLRGWAGIGSGIRYLVGTPTAEDNNQCIKQRHEHSFHVGNARGPVPEKSRISIRTEFLVGTSL